MPGTPGGSSYAAVGNFSGTVTPTGTGVLAYYVFPWKSGRIGGMAFNITTPGTGTANVVNVMINGVTVFAQAADRPTGAVATAGAMTQGSPSAKGLRYEDVITIVGVTNGSGAALMHFSIGLEKA